MMRYRMMIACSIALLSGIACEAGIRSPGKYCGTVIYDRWDGCILYSGIYVTYVSREVKDDLRAYEGRAVEVEALKVFQPINPGDARIDKLKYLGDAPETGESLQLKGLSFATSIKISDNDGPLAVITIKNDGDKPVTLQSAL